jgi:hypothetical protein
MMTKLSNWSFCKVFRHSTVKKSDTIHHLQALSPPRGVAFSITSNRRQLWQQEHHQETSRNTPYSPFHLPCSAPTNITNMTLKASYLTYKSLHKLKAYHPIINLTQRLLPLKVRAIFSNRKEYL